MHSPKECWFDHERLEVYQESIAFIAWLSTLLDETVRVGGVKDQWKSQVRIPPPIRCTRAVVRVRRSG